MSSRRSPQVATGHRPRALNRSYRWSGCFPLRGRDKTLVLVQREASPRSDGQLLKRTSPTLDEWQRWGLHICPSATRRGSGSLPLALLDWCIFINVMIDSCKSLHPDSPPSRLSCFITVQTNGLGCGSFLWPRYKLGRRLAERMAYIETIRITRYTAGPPRPASWRPGRKAAPSGWIRSEGPPAARTRLASSISSRSAAPPP